MKVQFFKNYSWDTVPGAKSNGFNRQAVIERLGSMRQELEVLASDGKTLAEVSIPAGAVLSDFCDLLELNPEEREAVLGADLARVTA